MDDDRLKKAIALTQLAAEKDKEGKYEEAFDLYKTCLDNWHLACKYQPNPVLKERLYKKMEEYVSRAEQIKDYLKRKGDQTNDTLQSGGGGTAQQNPANQQIDSNDASAVEKGKLRQMMAGVIVTERPNVKWEDVAGLDAAKESLQEAVILPTKFPNLFVGERKPWKGILLYGPPGTGKTHLAKACATESSATFLSVSSADLVSKWQGESEKLVRTLFDMARQNKPSIVFIDEVDSMCGARSDGESESSRRIKTEFLVQMEGIDTKVAAGGGILVLGATNVPWELDAAIRRRFERRIYIPLPEVRARKRMFEIHVGKTPHTLTSKNFQTMAEMTEGFTGADIAVVVRDALFEPVRRCRSATHFKRCKNASGELCWTPCSPGDPDPTKEERVLMSIPGHELIPPDLSMWDFESVLENSRSSVAVEELKKHQDWTDRFGVEGR